MPQHIRSAWIRTLGALALWLLAALVVGVLLGHAWMALALAALAALGWSYWRLRRVLRRLTARQRWEPEPAQGAWNELDRLLYRSQ
ncbi:PAS domain-containing sensor histidine kinase, partial [Kosakonia sp. H7A]|uniref:phosphate regulon sensor protein PhoR n=1 Tax=Kosakonia sp. H7A TaxID=2054598 RepID=UPI000D4C8631